MQNSRLYPFIVDHLDDFWGITKDDVSSHTVIEGDKDYTVEIDMPGVKKEDIEISLDKGVMKISGKRKTASEKTYVKSFNVPQGVTDAHISAKYENGVAIVTVTKAEKDKKRTIKVS